MTNEEAINELLQCYSLYSPFKTAKKTNEAISMAIKALEGKDIDVPTKWIPVSKGLPEEKINPNTSDFEKVLCSTTFGDVRAYKCGTPYGWEKPHFWRGLNVMDEYVLAWMPLPEPWKGE